MVFPGLPDRGDDAELLAGRGVGGIQVRIADHDFSLPPRKKPSPLAAPGQQMRTRAGRPLRCNQRLARTKPDFLLKSGLNAPAKPGVSRMPAQAAAV